MNLQDAKKRQNIGTRLSNLESMVQKSRISDRQNDIQMLNKITNDFLHSKRGLTRENILILNRIYRRYK